MPDDRHVGIGVVCIRAKSHTPFNSYWKFKSARNSSGRAECSVRPMRLVQSARGSSSPMNEQLAPFAIFA